MLLHKVHTPRPVFQDPNRLLITYRKHTMEWLRLQLRPKANSRLYLAYKERCSPTLHISKTNKVIMVSKRWVTIREPRWIKHQRNQMICWFQIRSIWTKHRQARQGDECLISWLSTRQLMLGAQRRPRRYRWIYKTALLDMTTPHATKGPREDPWNPRFVEERQAKVS